MTTFKNRKKDQYYIGAMRRYWKTMIIKALLDCVSENYTPDRRFFLCILFHAKSTLNNAYLNIIPHNNFIQRILKN